MDWLLSRLNPWSKYHAQQRIKRALARQAKEQRRNKEREESAQRKLPKLTSKNRINIGDWDQLNGPFFELDPNVREQILREAFGDQTVHLDLDFRHPFKLLTSNKKDLETKKRQYPHEIHANISANIGLGIMGDVYDRNVPKSWRWFGCVCHRNHPRHQLSHGRRGSSLAPLDREPQRDRCLAAKGLCAKYPGEWPDKCFIGVIGWLLSCRQAYWEGIDVLYRTNTIHVASSTLICGIENFLTLNVLSTITSLELVWNLENLPPDEVFNRCSSHNASLGRSGMIRPSGTFPSLRHLRIAFKPLIFSEKPFGIDLGLGYSHSERLEETKSIFEYFLPKLDQMLDRIAPPTTEIVISWADWGIYSYFDLELLKIQGQEKTQMHQLKIGGLCCWREVPSPESHLATSRDSQEREVRDSARDGYWIHVAEPNFEHALEGYDWNRHGLYGLGPEKLPRYSRSNPWMPLDE